ncbi:MAG: YiaA/YiaB family inner membrane protein [Chloroflexota bacterium]
MKDVRAIQQDSPAWKFFVVVSFVIALGSTSLGVLILPIDFWVKGYIAMGLYFTLSSTFILSKTLRDSHEASKLVNKISEARTSKMLKDFDLDS